MTDRKRTIVRGVLTLLVVCGAGVLLIPHRAPALGRSLGADFDRDRAMTHIRALSTAPRPAGSAESVRAGEYLCGAVTALGLECAVQELSPQAVEHPPRNVLTRIAGSRAGGAVLLTAHRDTVRDSPGAMDNGAGCAVLLEVGRVLTTESRRPNDVILLWTDSKESGRGGIQAFLNSHPWAKDVQVVVNVDPRGTGGPALMFETNEPNGWAIRRFGDASPAPAATSFMGVVEALMPNGLDDFGWIKRAGVPGLNFVLIGGSERYHRATDTAATVDPSSLDHLGRQVVAVARTFASDTLPSESSSNVIYFDVAQRWLVSYPEGWALPTVLLGLGLLAYGIVSARGAGALHLQGLLPCAAVYGGLSIAVAAVCLIGGPTVASLTRTSQGYTYAYLLAAVALAMGLATAFARRRIRRDGWTTTAAGMALCWILLSIASAALAPATSYFFAWPLVAAGLALSLRTTLGGGSTAAVAAAVVALPVLVLCLPTNYVILAALGMRGFGMLVFLLMQQAGVFAMVPLLLFEPHLAPAPADLVAVPAAVRN